MSTLFADVLVIDLFIQENSSTESYLNDTFQYSQLWKYRQNNICFQVLHLYLIPLLITRPALC